MFPADPLEKEAVEQAQEAEYEGVRTKVIVPEYLCRSLPMAGDARKMSSYGRFDRVMGGNVLDGKGCGQNGIMYRGIGKGAFRLPSGGAGCQGNRGAKVRE